MKIKNIEIMKLRIPFKKKFTHALKSRSNSDNILIRVISESNKFGIGESLPRQYVTGESINSVLRYYNNVITKKYIGLEFKNFKEGIEFLIKESKKLKKNELSAFGGFSDAVLNLICQEFNVGIEEILIYLKIKYNKKKQIDFSAIIGEANLFMMVLKALVFKKRGFKQVKIKVSPNDFATNKIKYVCKILKNSELRIDGNCSFNYSDIKKIISDLKISNIKYFEQPYSINYNKKEEISNLLNDNGIKVIHDEDFCSFNDIDKFKEYGNFANLRLNKNGGIINSLLIYKELLNKKINLTFECLVGETVLTRYNLILDKYFKTIANAADYDKYLFKDRIIDEPDFNEHGILNTNKSNFDLNQNIKLNKNHLKYIISKKIYS